MGLHRSFSPNAGSTGDQRGTGTRPCFRNPETHIYQTTIRYSCCSYLDRRNRYHVHESTEFPRAIGCGLSRRVPLEGRRGYDNVRADSDSDGNRPAGAGDTDRHGDCERDADSVGDSLANSVPDTLSDAVADTDADSYTFADFHNRQTKNDRRHRDCDRTGHGTGRRFERSFRVQFRGPSGLPGGRLYHAGGGVPATAGRG